jgi:hypothetical protein
MVHNRELYPPKLQNDRGELVFALHEAKQLLREDVKEAKHAHMLLELEIKHKHGGFNINYEKATVVWQQFGFAS